MLIIFIKGIIINTLDLTAFILALFDCFGYTRKQLMYFVEETPLLESASKLRLYLRPLSAWGCDSNLESRRPLMQPNHRNRPPIMNSTA